MNDMAVMFLLLMIVFSILGVGLFVVKKAMVVTDPGAEGVASDEEVSTAQDFIPIVDIKDSMICLGNHRYRAVIECSSVNYMLKTEREREVIEQSFQRFISSVTFPISFHIQTRAIDNTEVVRALEKDISQINLNNKLMEDYAKMYLESMKSFDAYIGNAKQKKKYIIISYEDAYGLTELTSAEKEEFSRQQLQELVDFVKGQLSSIGIKSERLDNQGLIELLYSSYHREDMQYDMVQALSQGQFMNSVVMGNVKSNKITAEEKIDFELVRIQNLIKEEYLDITLGKNSEQYQKMAEIYNNIDQVRTIVDRPYGGELKIDVESDRIQQVRTSAKKNEQIHIKEEVKDEEDDFSFDFDKQEEEIEDFSFDFGDTKEEVKDEEDDFSFDFDKQEEEIEDFSFDFGDTKEEVKDEEDDFSFDFDKQEEEIEDFSFDFGENELDKLFEDDQDDDIVITKPSKRR